MVGLFGIGGGGKPKGKGHGKTEAENERITHDCAYEGLCSEGVQLGGLDFMLSHAMPMSKSHGQSIGSSMDPNDLPPGTDGF